ncbi:hypothetical protein EV356DRAFT_495337 [Viridothelium virens]|uniref:Rhodopsin domain-containing protein n=1 Tax=Viridothelium virens TaxID=1048519 RepID=A0A6A6GS10_VIRVR|nr:hypothetical protein EV356DRAFT_495337 [Viridothelium virens]
MTSQLTPDQLLVLLNGPALEPPAGVIPNFAHPPNQDALYRAIIVICLSLSVIFVSLRMYHKLLTKRMYLEDFGIILSVGLFVGICMIVLVALNKIYLFVHQWDMQLKELSYTLKILYVVILLYAVLMLLLKPCILLDWIRIFVPMGQRTVFFYTATALMAANIIFYIVGFFIQAFRCHPVEHIWNLLSPGTCIDHFHSFIASSVINVILDVAILILPQRAIWDLNIPTSRKLSLSIVFLVGVIAIVGAIGRAWAAIRLKLSEDNSFTIAQLALFSLTEITAGLMVACMPYVPKVFGEIQQFLMRIRSIRSLPSSSKNSDSTELSDNLTASGQPLDSELKTYGRPPSTSSTRDGHLNPQSVPTSWA